MSLVQSMVTMPSNNNLWNYSEKYYVLILKQIAQKGTAFHFRLVRSLRWPFMRRDDTLPYRRFILLLHLVVHCVNFPEAICHEQMLRFNFVWKSIPIIWLQERNQSWSIILVYSICGYITRLACCKFMEIMMENYISTVIRLRLTFLQPENNILGLQNRNTMSVKCGFTSFALSCWVSGIQLVNWNN